MLIISYARGGKRCDAAEENGVQQAASHQHGAKTSYHIYKEENNLQNSRSWSTLSEVKQLIQRETTETVPIISLDAHRRDLAETNIVF
ncbi:hypothetical protein PFLUV_G00220340 [Perca fluviatilis]|uniref:Uncharacterized protein n=1 Tax=Perca fluviatilis TaxID=8168 RepID=A0A6A5EN65_PERFL|nr:hypothetical protein PFLUV_G00220340 [Perca fluviatilis]